MPLKHINTREAGRLVDGGAILVDVRGYNGYAAANHPLSRKGAPLRNDAPAIVFHCKSGELLLA